MKILGMFTSKYKYISSPYYAKGSKTLDKRRTIDILQVHESVWKRFLFLYISLEQDALSNQVSLSQLVKIALKLNQYCISQTISWRKSCQIQKLQIVQIINFVTFLHSNRVWTEISWWVVINQMYLFYHDHEYFSKILFKLCLTLQNLHFKYAFKYLLQLRNQNLAGLTNMGIVVKQCGSTLDKIVLMKKQNINRPLLFSSFN
ncbi:Hypothetical_protein [Hexamita inflata]|uniref:Hypothetical_protein n=1 Tax=Hexamita inflata TaxID=28002 RepID=A0AA86P6M9_9EUKA|nr:Hypothetical protein HINF_LOCUS19346 [Hexamita inflata]